MKKQAPELMNEWRIFLTVVLSFFFIFILMACKNKENEGNTGLQSNVNSRLVGSDKHNPIFQLVYHNETRGEFVDCGCCGSKKEDFPIARRPAALKANMDAKVSNAFIERGYTATEKTESLRPSKEFKNRKYIELLKLWECDALLPDKIDFLCSIEEFKERHNKTEIPIVASNLDSPIESLHLRKSLILNANEFSVLIINVVTPTSYNTEYPHFKFGDELEAVKRELKTNAGKFQGALVFADSTISYEKVEEIGRIPGVTLVLGGKNRERALKHADLNLDGRDYPQLFFGNNRVTGILTLYADNSGEIGAVEFKHIELEKYEIDEEALAFVKNNWTLTKARLEEDIAKYHLENPQIAAKRKSDLEFKYAGSIACFDCHLEIANAWRAEPHSQAMPTLSLKGEDKNPECINCHSVAFNSGGFKTGDSIRSRFAGVGCESCHGPGSAHISIKQGDKEAKLPKSWQPKPDGETCAGCHQGIHDPGFDFAEKSPEICCIKTQNPAGTQT